MNVLKRNGTFEPINLQKIIKAISRAAEGIDHVNPHRVAAKTIANVYDGVSTAELDQRSIETAASLIAEEPNYSKLAPALLLEVIRKELERQGIQFTGGSGVHGDVRVLHRYGYEPIRSLVGKEIQVFNGVEWSKAVPFLVATQVRMVRVRLSDGSFFDCAPGHQFMVKRSRQAKFSARTSADGLIVGDLLPPTRVRGDIEGDSEPEAYTYGAFLGDGGIELRKDTGKSRFKLSLYRGKHHLPVSGTRGKMAKKGEITVTVSHLDHDRLRQMKEDGLPDWVFALDRASTGNFIAGMIDTDGSFYKGTGGVVFDTSNETTARDFHRLVRRYGCSFASVQQTAKIGDVTNFGPRKKPMFRVYIPESEAGLLGGFRVKTDRELGLQRVVKQPRVAAVERLIGSHDSYSLVEPLRGMVTLGTILTFDSTCPSEGQRVDMGASWITACESWVAHPTELPELGISVPKKPPVAEDAAFASELATA
jgi:hypothetical protein